MKNETNCKSTLKYQDQTGIAWDKREFRFRVVLRKYVFSFNEKKKIVRYSSWRYWRIIFLESLTSWCICWPKDVDLSSINFKCIKLPWHQKHCLLVINLAMVLIYWVGHYSRSPRLYMCVSKLLSLGLDHLRLIEEIISEQNMAMVNIPTEISILGNI